MRSSNDVVGLLNFLTFLLAIPILGSGIWLSTRVSASDCLKFLQWPIIIIGVSIMLISLAGFAGACYRKTFLMYVYLGAMFFVIAAIVVFIIFAYVVTDKGSGRPVTNRAYKEYHLEDYSGWLEERVTRQSYWSKIRSCVRDSKVCAKLGRKVGGVTESADLFYLRKLTPIQSGCCKPPTDCGYTYENETYWDDGGGVTGGDNSDCNQWSNEQQQLCYDCDSCKAGVLASLKKSWRKATLINVVVLVILVVVYVVACAAFRHNRRIDNDEPDNEDRDRMEKEQPSANHF